MMFIQTIKLPLGAFILILGVLCGITPPLHAQTARVIEITGNDSMKFDVTKIDAAPGEIIKVVLKNVGTLPKEAMGHNWVLLGKSVDPNKFAMSVMSAKATDYLPATPGGDVLAHTKLLGPGESDTVEFTAPSEPGDYPYICSFPAHCMAGMKGILTVK
jgi:azurin